jgi:membrane fusion protein (multidrug efflux system)
LPVSETNSEKPARRNPLSRPSVRNGLLIGGVAIVVIALVFGFQWWTHGRFVQETNDAYLRADQVAIAPKVQGYVEQVLVSDNQEVAVGQPLVKIDASTYRTSSAQQKAAVDARKADIESAGRQVAQQRAAVDQARAQLAAAQSNAAFAADEFARFSSLSSQGVETKEKAEQARNQNMQAQATLKANEAALRQAERQVETLKSQSTLAAAQLEAANAQAEAAQINLADTELKASIAGRVGDRTVRVGQYVQPGTRLMSIVPVNDVYLVANFKETQIAHMRAGQPAEVKVDALGGRKLKAVVESFAPGTGSQFALLPAENATGNFTKIVQRVPVRLRVTVPDDLHGLLLPGLSATVKVDTSVTPDAKK